MVREYKLAPAGPHQTTSLQSRMKRTRSPGRSRRTRCTSSRRVGLPAALSRRMKSCQLRVHRSCTWPCIMWPGGVSRHTPQSLVVLLRKGGEPPPTTGRTFSKPKENTPRRARQVGVAVAKRFLLPQPRLATEIHRAVVVIVEGGGGGWWWWVVVEGGGWWWKVVGGMGWWLVGVEVGGRRGSRMEEDKCD